MSEVPLLSLVARYPHPTALARRVRDGSAFVALRRLEARGFLRRQDGTYLLTHRGRSELAMAGVLVRLLARTRRHMP
jgi:DNA-binding PadR family transcriptional regulator